MTNAAAAGVALSGSATAFTIADLSTVWILCDVYENDIPKMQVRPAGARFKLSAYPDQVLTGRVSDIGPVLDPSIRTAKVRIEVANPGILRLGMFVTATFSSQTTETLCRRARRRRPASARSRLGVSCPRAATSSGAWK